MIPRLRLSPRAAHIPLLLHLHRRPGPHILAFNPLLPPFILQLPLQAVAQLLLCLDILIRREIQRLAVLAVSCTTTQRKTVISRQSDAQCIVRPGLRAALIWPNCSGKAGRRQLGTESEVETGGPLSHQDLQRSSHQTGWSRKIVLPIVLAANDPRPLPRMPPLRLPLGT